MLNPSLFSVQYGTPSFLPYLHHLIGQPGPPPTAASSGSASSGAAGGSGILGCLSRHDWAVRCAAADALSGAGLLLGPSLEPEGAWGAGDPASLTGRCLAALEPARFDKVRFGRCFALAIGVLSAVLAWLMYGWCMAKDQA
jgi:hypothetical protein